MVAMGPNYYVESPKQQFLSPQRAFLGGIGLIIALVVGMLLLSASGGQPTNTALLQRSALRLGGLTTFLDNPQVTRNIKDESLSQLVTNASITLTSDQNALNELLPQTKYPATMVSEETDTISKTKLEQAQLEGTLDRTFADIYTTKIRALRALLAETVPKTPSKDIRQVLVKTDTHLSDQQKQLEQLNL